MAAAMVAAFRRDYTGGMERICFHGTPPVREIIANVFKFVTFLV